MKDVGAENLWKSVNIIQPSLIRTESDEATYNLHIMIRYEIEKKLISGEIEVDDLPRIWNEMYDEFLGIEVPNDSLGVLQDVHWSMGAFGYFPTYTLGNLYSAQLLSAAKKDIGDINKQIQDGNFSPLLEWMREKIHARGSIIEPAELIKEATGHLPSSDEFIEYLENKISDLYGFDGNLN
jgi:carboxypeptidase Taq